MLAAAALALGLRLDGAATSASCDTGVLSDVVVTARRREETAQKAPLSVTAIVGADLVRDRVLTLEDLSHDQTGISFTANSPQAFEVNIRGIVNTRLTAPTADQSVSTFIDGVYVNRSGVMNSAFFDVARIEIVRGPQGVLLGKNVAGGAVNVINSGPETIASGSLTLTAGNYGLRQAEGYVTGSLSDAVSGRLAFQVLHHDGYARDLLHGTDLENLDSAQVRAELAYHPAGADLTASTIVEVSHEASDGENRVGVKSATLPAGPNIWSGTRQLISDALGRPLTIRESYPVWPLFSGDAAATPQGADHKTFSVIEKVEKPLGSAARIISVTGLRTGHAFTLYDQTGLGPRNGFDFTPAQLALVGSGLLFAEPQNFAESNQLFTEDVRIASTAVDRAWDWLVGAYVLESRVVQHNRYWGESLVLPTLSGESHWNDIGRDQDYAIFGQIGLKLARTLKLDVGARYTWDIKSGTQEGLAIATGDALDPRDTAPLTPLTQPFKTPYRAAWSRLTPQATLTWTASDLLMFYGTVSEGFKGGGFQNNAPNAFAAKTPYNPEVVTNYEVGAKGQSADRSLRASVTVFSMSYRNLQVQETNATCLCAVLSNAASASINGIETALDYAPTRHIRFWTSASALDATYKQFVFAGVDNSGRQLQRTPKWQSAVGADVVMDTLGWEDALTARVSYHYQARMPWAPENTSWEPGYGTLDARVTLTKPGANWSLSAWAKNLADTVYRTNVIVFFNDEMSSYGPPRTFGFDLVAAF